MTLVHPSMSWQNIFMIGYKIDLNLISVIEIFLVLAAKH